MIQKFIPNIYFIKVSITKNSSSQIIATQIHACYHNHLQPYYTNDTTGFDSLYKKLDVI